MTTPRLRSNGRWYDWGVVVLVGGLGVGAVLFLPDVLAGTALIGIAATVGGGDIDRVIEAARRLGEGDYDIEPPPDPDEDLGRLWDAMEGVANRLQDSEGSLETERGRIERERNRRSSLFESVSDPVARVRTRDDFRVVEVNDRFTSEFETGRDAASGRRLVDCLGGSERLEETLDDVQFGDTVEHTLRFPGEDGTRIFELRLVPIPQPNGGRPDEGYAIFVDVAGQREAERSERIRQTLYDITSDSSLSSERKIQRLLELGCEWFDLDNGFLSDIDAELGDYYVEQAVGDAFMEAGETVPLQQTFCRETMTDDDILAIYDAVEAGYGDDPGYEESDIACYFGARIEVHGELYGTFCFFDDEPTDRPFSHVDRTVLDLMARWVSYELERRERERELRLKDRAMHAAPVGITITETTEPDHPIVYANEAFASLTGYEPEAVQGRGHEFLYGPGTDPETIEAAKSALADERATSVECRNYRADGSEFWTRIHLAPVADESGTVTHFVHFREDITDRIENQRHLSAIVENTDVPIFIKDLDGVYQFANEATADVFGLTSAEVLGKTDAELFDRESVGEIRAADTLVTETGEAVTRETVTSVDGTEHIWLDTKYPFRDADGEIIGVMGISKDITERKRRERELERYERILESIDDIAFVVDDDRRLVYINERIEELVDGPKTTLVGEPFPSLAEEYVVTAEDRTALLAALDGAFDETDPHAEPERVEITVAFDGEERVFQYQFSPLVEDGSVITVACTVRDVTRYRAQERVLTSLHDTTRELLTVEQPDAVAERIVAAGSSVLEDAAVALYRLDSEAGVFEPVAHVDGSGDRTDGPATVDVGDTDSNLWSCFVTENPLVFDDSGAVDVGWAGLGAVEGGLLVPIGDHGVLVVASLNLRIDERERQIVETLAATTEAAFDRLESDAERRRREAELEQRNLRLERQIRATDLVRGIHQSLVDAESREEIEEAVCQRLVETDDVAFAWIGSPDDAVIEPRTWAGEDASGYLDAVSLGTDSDEPAAVADRERRPALVDEVAERVLEEQWAEHATSLGFQSVLAVPLVIADHSYGVLAVYGTESGTFRDFEREIFAELGTIIADAFDAVQVRRALHAERYTELELTVADADTTMAQIADETGEPVTYEGVTTASDEASRLFVATATSPAAVTPVLDDLVSVTDYQLVRAGDEDVVFELTVTTGTFPEAVANAGGNPRSIRAEGSDLTAVVDVPANAEVREFVDRLQGRQSDVELRSRRERESQTQRRTELVSSLLSDLTDRQRETLRTAYFAGFFEWPRESTGEDVAEMLGITQPTVNRHLRLGQQTLFDHLFGPDDYSPE